MKKVNLSRPFHWLGLNKISTGLQLFLFGLVMIIMVMVSKSAAPLMMLGFIPAVKLDGLDRESDEYKFLSDLNKRFKEFPDGLTEDKAKAMIEEAFKAYKGLDVAKMMEMLDEKTGFAALKAAVKIQGEAITALQESGKRDTVKSVRQEVEKWVNENKNLIGQVKGGAQNVSLPPINISKESMQKAITMLESASLGGSAYLPNAQVLPGVIDLVRVQPTFWNYLRKQVSKANPLIWVNKYNKLGNAVFTSEGSAKQLASFELQTESSVPRKVAEKMKISTEMLDDIDYLTGVIMDELRYEVDTASNAGVLTGTGVAPNPKGVTVYASLYTLATITGVTTPNNSDAIRAAIAQLRSLNYNGPLTAFVNPIDAAIMDLKKNSQGSYVLPPFETADGRVIAATPVVEDNNIAVGYLLIGDLSKYHVFMHTDFQVAWGWENDDFTKNLVTVIGERRFHAWVSGNEVTAFIYDTFANIKTAIA